MNFKYGPPNLNSESTWKEFSVALARKVMTLSHGFKNDEVKDESLKEALILTQHVWDKQQKDLVQESIQTAIKECNPDEEDRAADYLQDNTEHNPTDMKREEVLTKAIQNGWERYPEPTDEELSYGSEPPITLDEMYSKAHKQHIKLHS